MPPHAFAACTGPALRFVLLLRAQNQVHLVTVSKEVGTRSEQILESAKPS